MNIALKKQLDDMTDNELADVLRRDFMRKIARYMKIDEIYRKEYGIDFKKFEETNMVKKLKYSFKVENDAQEWELAIDGILTFKKKLKELSSGN